MARKARWAAAAAVGAVAAGASLWMLTPASATGSVNPVEGGLGFLVLVERDATLTGTESEGPIAVGGDLTFGSGYRIATERSVRVGSGGSPLVIGGRALVDAPAVVDATVIGADGTVKTAEDGGLVVRAAASATPEPGERARLAKQDSLDLAGVFAAFRERSTQFGRCAETVTLRNSGGGEVARPISNPGTRAYLSLTPGQTNVLNLTGDEFNNLADLTFNTQPSAETPVLVNVGTDASYEWRTANFAGVTDKQAPYILMNFPDATSITQVGADTAEGTIYAPNASFTDVNTANNEGNLVVRDYTHGTAATNGGETHDLPFNTTLECGAAPDDTPVTAPAAPHTPSADPTATASGDLAPTEPARTDLAAAGLVPTDLAPTAAGLAGTPGVLGTPTLTAPAWPTLSPDPTASVVPGAAGPPPVPFDTLPTLPTPTGDPNAPWAWLNEPPYVSAEPPIFAGTAGPVTTEPTTPAIDVPLVPGTVADPYAVAGVTPMPDDDGLSAANDPTVPLDAGVGGDGTVATDDAAAAGAQVDDGGALVGDGGAQAGDSGVLAGDAGAQAGDGGVVDPAAPFLPFGSASASPSVTASPSTPPAVVANYGPLPGQGGAQSAEALNRPSTIRLAIAGLAILVVSTALLLLGRRRRRRYAARY